MNSSILNYDIARRTVLIGLGAGLSALALPGRLQAQAGGGVLRFGLSTFPPSIKPHDNTGQAANTVKLMMLRGLMGYDNEGKLTPELAESSEMVDPLNYIFKLREAKFHNGAPVTAGDVVFSLNQITQEGSSSFLKSDLAAIENVEALDERTVHITLSSPIAVLLDLLANYNAPIISAESTEENTIGAGPFRLKDQERGVYIELERFEDFYEPGKPIFDGVRFIAYSDENLRYAALEAGDVDLIEYLPWQNFDMVDASDTLKMTSAQGPFMFLLFNVSDPESPLANPKVRQAIGFAVKRQDVVDAAFAGRGEPLNGFPNPPGSPFDLSGADHEWSFDPDRATALLTEAGYPDGFDCTLLATSTYGMHQDTASVVQAYLQMIGINATLDLPDWASRVTAGTEGKYDIAVHGTAGYYNDPDSIYALLHSSNPSYLQSFGFKSERIDDLLTRGRQETDPDARAGIYRELAVAYFEEVPQVPLNWRQQAYAMRNEVSGFNAFPGFLTFASPYCVEDTSIS